MASGNTAMVLEQGDGWTRGLRNMLRGELVAWFGTRTWWTQILIWFASINLVYLVTAFSSKDTGLEAATLFNIFMGLVVPVGVTIVMQLAVVGEKRGGTAAWILSKPVSRPAFLISKLISNALGLAVTLVLAQGVIAYLITGLIVGDWLAPAWFLAALGAHLSHVLFYLAFTLMLGVLFDHPGPVIGIPLGFMFAQQFVGAKLAELGPAFANVLPWTIAIPLNGGGPGAKSVTMALMAGQPVPLTAVYVALAASVVFVAVGIVVFQRQEL